MKLQDVIEGCAVFIVGALLALSMVAVFATGIVLAALRLIVTPGGATIVIALIGLYVWLNGGFA